MGRFKLFIILMMFFFSFVFGRQLSLTEICSDLEKKYGSFTVLVTKLNGTEDLFSYQKELLENRYAIGSLIKPFTYLASAKTNLLDETYEYHCQGFREYTEDKICWYQPGHGIVKFSQALALSCNSYFYDYIVNNKLSRENLLEVLNDFGLNYAFKPYGLTDEKFFRSAIGLDGYLLATPRSVASAYFRLFDSKNAALEKSSAGNGSQKTLEEKYSKEKLAQIQEGMRGAYVYGTGKPIFAKLGVENLAVKTGTSMGGKGGVLIRKTCGWVIVLYPAEKPELSFLILVEKGRGGKEAAEIAAVIIKEILSGRTGLFR